MLLRCKPKNNLRLGFTLVECLISFFIFGMMVGGLIYGYVQINRMAEFSSMSIAAQSFASQGLEEARSVQFSYVRWPNTNADQFDPFWTVNGTTNLTPQVNTLDVPTSGAPIYVTNFVTVTSACTNLIAANAPLGSSPLRQIRSDCVWTFPLTGQLCTNTAISLRAPDQ